jgi:hypothetical protein
MDKAISLHRDTLERPVSHPNHASFFLQLPSLASCFRPSRDRGGTFKDIDEDISLQREALQLYPAGPPQNYFLICSKIYL